MRVSHFLTTTTFFACWHTVAVNGQQPVRNSEDFAGATVSDPGGEVTAVTGSLHVPLIDLINVPAGNYVTGQAAVGIDSRSCRSLFLVGVAFSHSFDRGLAYDAFAQFGRAYPTWLRLEIGAGDLLDLRAETDGAEGVATVINVTRNLTKTVRFDRDPRLCQGSAEWVVLDSEYDGPKKPRFYGRFANFTRVDFINPTYTTGSGVKEETHALTVAKSTLLDLVRERERLATGAMLVSHSRLSQDL